MKAFVCIGSLTVASFLLSFTQVQTYSVQTPTPTPTIYSNETVKIVAPQTANSGDLVVLRVEGEAEALTWKVLPHTSNFRVFDNGRTAVFSSRGGSYTVLLAASTRDGDTGASVELIVHSLVVKTVEPTDLDVTVWCRQINASKAEARKLSQSFASVAILIDSGILKTPEDIVKATTASNKAALGETALAKWTPFFENLRIYLNGKQLKTSEEHSSLWKTVAQQLEAYEESNGPKSVPSRNRRLASFAR